MLAVLSAMVPFVATLPGPAAHASPESPNLLVGDHGSFDLTTGGWVGGNASVAHVTSPTQAGLGALAMAATSAGTAGAVSGNGPTTWTPAQAGQVYTGSAWTEAASTGRSVDAALGFISSTGTTTTAVWGQVTPDVTTGWTHTTPVVGIAPPGTAYVELVVYVYGAGQGETHYVDTASLTTHAVTNAAVTGPLHTSGNTIYDATNAPLRLRGDNVDWLDFSPSIPSGSPLDDNSVAHMKQWGVNGARVHLSEDYWNPNDCSFSSGYAAAVDQAVQSITSRGMVALLDLHSNTRQSSTCATSKQQRMADSPGAVTFWSSVAARYQSNPLVAFDLYNEPHDLTWPQWLNGGSLTDSDGVTWQAAGMQQLYDAVRGTGARNLVFVSGNGNNANGWAAIPPPATSLVAGYNIVYAAHYYTCPTQAPPACTTSDPYNPAPPGQRLDAWSPLATTQPMMVTEFGWPDPGNGTYYQNVVNWAEAKGIGWTAHKWAPGTAGTNPFGFLADQSVFEPAASGMPVLAGLAGPVPSASPVPNCTTFYSTATGSHQVCGAIRDKYLALGGPTSFLGFPTTDTTGTPDGIGQFNHFANSGSIYWTSSTGAWSIHGAIRAKWASMGWEQSILGYPTTDETGTSDGAGRYNDFSSADGYGASIYWTSSTGAWSIHGAIRGKYLALGGPTSFLGYPITDETGTPDGVGRFNHFSSADGYGASIYWTPSTGAWSIHGTIRSKWASMGWERSCLGYPVSDEFAIPGGRQSNLQRGVITYSFSSGQATSSC